MRQGLGYIKEHLYSEIFYISSYICSSMPVAFLTYFRLPGVLHDWRLTIETAFSGMILAGRLWPSGRFSNKVYTMTFSCLLIGATTAALGLTPFFWLYIIFMVLSGVAMPIFNTPATVLLQVNVEEDFLGRVFGILMMISSTMMPLGMVIFGPMSDAIKIEWILLVTGVLIFIMAFSLSKNKALLKAGKEGTNIRTQ